MPVINDSHIFQSLCFSETKNFVDNLFILFNLINYVIVAFGGDLFVFPIVLKQRANIMPPRLLIV